MEKCYTSLTVLLAPLLLVAISIVHFGTKSAPVEYYKDLYETIFPMWLPTWAGSYHRCGAAMRRYQISDAYYY